MDISKNRLEAFSDGVIAIIITIMVLDIPMPKSFTFNGIKTVLTSFFIYFISFIVVGSQWFKHNYLFSIYNKIYFIIYRYESISNHFRLLAGNTTMC